MKSSKNLVKKIKLTSVALMVMSCSSMNHSPESIQSKMNRFSPNKEDQFVAPDFLIIKTGKLTNVNLRTPASSLESSKLRYSNKRLYFLSLLDQYYKLSNYSENSTPKIKMCPSFHSANLTYLQKKKISYKTQLKIDFTKNTKFWDDSYRALYPILQLPVTSRSVYPTVANILTNGKKDHYKTVHEAINIHIIKVYKELKTLCQYGSSDNYYSFENLITHIQTNKGFTSEKQNLKTLFKSPIFSNMTLLNSLEYKRKGRGPASHYSKNIYSDEIVRRLNINWFNSYLRESKKIKKEN